MNTIRQKPSKKSDDFINQAGSSLIEGKTRKKKALKKQIPVMIPEALLISLDEQIESSMVGLSRSAWICQAIKEKLNRED